MAKKPKRGSYLNLEDVRVFYDSKTDTISLTSGDEDLPEAGGLKIDLSPGTQNERQLRELLKLKGVIRWDPWPKISPEDTRRMILESPEAEVHIGTDIQGEAVAYSAFQYPALWTHGAIGEGATFFASLFAAHAAVKGWKTYSIDPKLDFYRISEYSTDMTVVYESGDSLPLIQSIRAELRERSPEEKANPRGRLLALEDPRLILEELGDETRRIDFLDELNELVRLARSMKLAVQINGDFPLDSSPAIRQRLSSIWHLSEHVFVGNYPSERVPPEFRANYSSGRGRSAGMGQYRGANFQIGSLLENPVNVLKRKMIQRAAS